MNDQPSDLVGELAIPPLALTALAIDYDGVIHQYSRGWHDGTCYDGPMSGALAAIDSYRRVRPVAVVTARPLNQVEDWFDRHLPHVPLYVDNGLHRAWWNELGTVLLTNRKIVAQHYIDDRAIRFGRGQRGMAADWEDARTVIHHWDEEYRRRYSQVPRGAEPCG